MNERRNKSRGERACPSWEEALLLHADRELDGEALNALTAHLKTCETCARALAELEAQTELLDSPWPEERIAGFESIAYESLIARKERLSKRGMPAISTPRKWIAAASVAAAVLLLVWGFMMSVPYDFVMGPAAGEGAILAKTDENNDENDVKQPLAEDEDRTGGFVLPTEEECQAARHELRGILSNLASVSDMTLQSEFETRTKALREQGWRMDYMLRTVIKKDSGLALNTALRLARMDSGLQRLPGMVSALNMRLKEGCETGPILDLLAAIDDARSRDQLGDALKDPALRERALVLLERTNDDRAARWIADALQRVRTLDDPENEPFVSGCVRALSLAGVEGVDLLVKTWDRFEQPPSWIDVLAESSSKTVRACETLCECFDETPLYPFWLEAYRERNRLFKFELIDRIGRMRGEQFQAGLRMAAQLRLQRVLPYLIRQGDTFVHDEAPWLAARVGGCAGVAKLVEMYEAPVSIRMRKRVCSALSLVFELYPEEMGDVLEQATHVLIGENRTVLMDMLAEAGDAPACNALAWLLENKPSLGSAASLALARTGSRSALEALMNLLIEDRLDSQARLAATAAAYHLGGRTVLRRIDLVTGEESGKAGAARISRSSSSGERLTTQGSITQARFNRLKGYISSSRIHRKSENEKEAK